MGEPSTLLEALTAEMLGDVGKLHDLVTSLNGELPGLAADVRQAGQAAAARMDVAVDKAVTLLAGAAAQTEAARLQGDITRMVGTALEQVRKEARASSAPAWSSKLGLVAAAVLLVVGVAGGVIGSFVFPQVPELPAETKNQILAGQDFIAIFPQLDEATRKKIELLVSQRKSAADAKSH